jgi:hypothetical protein
MSLAYSIISLLCSQKNSTLDFSILIKNVDVSALSRLLLGVAPMKIDHLFFTLGIEFFYE